MFHCCKDKERQKKNPDQTITNVCWWCQQEWAAQPEQMVLWCNLAVIPPCGLPQILAGSKSWFLRLLQESMNYPISYQLTPFYAKVNQHQLVLFAVNNSGWYNKDWRIKGLCAGHGDRENLPGYRETFSYPHDEGRHTHPSHLLKVM